ncbi:MAG: hypothetical protein RR206_06045 [Bacteroidaceae bacterium]
MRKIILLLCYVLFISAGYAQKRGQTMSKSKAQNTSDATVDMSKAQMIATYIAEYKFELAASLIQKQIAIDKRKKLATEQAEETLRTCRTGMNMLHATEKIVFIDSILVDRKTFLNAYQLGKEAGTIDTYNHFFNKNDTTWQMQNATIYENELEDKVYFPFPDKNGLPKIHAKYKINEKWSEAFSLPGIDKGNDIQGFPFVLSDGITLYYAAQSDESIGGYDIFVTRYNSDTKQFLKPENIGMPFNSLANDYLYAIDEFNDLGWFVSDRNQPADKVCIYIFIPTTQREAYDYSETSASKVNLAARINAISDTWTNIDVVKAAQTRLKSVLNNEKNRHEKKEELQFFITDGTLYTHYSQFRNSKARALAKEFVAKEERLHKEVLYLEKLRTEYATASLQRKKQITPGIKQLESETILLQTKLHEQEKEIRRLELGK